MENLEEKKKEYESPSTKKTQVELEEGICAVGSGQQVDHTKMKVEVEEWKTIENDVTFE